MTLKNIIIDQIKERGPLSFCDFMEMALYYPELGYYTSPRKKIGNDGDFYTSCTVSPLFGHMIARQLLEMWDLMNEKTFDIVEYGAGTGHLCKSILGYIHGYADRKKDVRYYIIEKSKSLRRAQEVFLDGENVRWVDSISDIPDLKGCVLANEVLDNFSVHRVLMKDELQEVFVDFDGDFREVLRPASQSIRDYFNDLRIQLPKGFSAEVCLGARTWISEIASRLQKGFVMTIDYGFTAGELLQEHRREGSVICYHEHKVSENFYSRIGEQDITAHVNFSALGLFASQCGLGFSGFRNQGPFLESLGFFEHMKSTRENDADPVAIAKKENLLSHVLIEDMGRKFKVLVLHKEMPAHSLRGFRQ